MGETYNKQRDAWFKGNLKRQAQLRRKNLGNGLAKLERKRKNGLRFKAKPGRIDTFKALPRAATSMQVVIQAAICKAHPKGGKKFDANRWWHK